MFIPESFPETSTNFSENFLKSLVKISIKFYLRIAQILVYSLPKIFREFPQIFIKISSVLNIFTISYSKFSNIFLKIYESLFKNFCDCSLNLL